MLLFILFIYIPLCFAIGVYAHNHRNRSAIGWTLFAFFISPLLAFAFVAASNVNKPRVLRVYTAEQEAAIAAKEANIYVGGYVGRLFGVRG
jgi:hypothetical protein